MVINKNICGIFLEVFHDFFQQMDQWMIPIPMRFMGFRAELLHSCFQPAKFRLGASIVSQKRDHRKGEVPAI